MKEEWKNIYGFEGIYQVSNLGRVKSIARYVTAKFGSRRLNKERILKAAKDTDGYYRVVLYLDGNKFTKKVHRIVAEAFVIGRFEGAVVNQKDENKGNNHADNLEWVTHAENMRYGTKSIRQGKKLEKPIKQLTIDGDLVATYNSIKEAEYINKIKRGTIGKALRGICKTSHGYFWEYMKGNE